MKVSLKEGWISLSTVYGTGREEWLFHRDEPDCDDAFNGATGEFIPVKAIRIMYCEADNIELEKT